MRTWTLIVSALAWTSCVASLPEAAGEASVQLEFPDGATTSVVYEPMFGQISITPPVEQQIEAIFRNDDPYVEVRVRVDAAQVRPGDTVSLPVATDLPTLQISVEEGTYTSAHSLAGGTMTFQVLTVTDAHAEIDVSYDVTLVEVDRGDTLRAAGRILSSYGDAPTQADAGVREDEENPADI